MKNGVEWQVKNPKYLEINLFQYHFIYVKPQTDPRSSNRDLHGWYTTSSKSQSSPVNSLPVYPHTVVTGSHHNIWVIYLRCLVFLSLIFRIQLVFCTLFPTKSRNSDFLNCIKLTGKKLHRLFGSRQHLHAKYCSTSHDNLPPVLSDSSFIITSPSDVWQMYFKMHDKPLNLRW
jgi:hypothetical protein